LSGPPVLQVSQRPAQNGEQAYRCPQEPPAS